MPCHAVPFPRVPAGLSAALPRGVLPHRAQPRPALGRALADRREPGVPWLVGSTLRAAACGLDPGQPCTGARYPRLVPRRRNPRGAAVSDRRHRAQSGRAGLVQIRGFRAGHVRAGPRTAGPRAAAGDQFLHVSADHGPDGRPCAPGSRYRSVARGGLHRVLSAPDRRPAGASGRDHSATAIAGAGHAAHGEHHRRSRAAPVGTGQETGSGGPVRRFRGYRLRRRRFRRGADVLRGLVRHPRLRSANLFRLLRLFRHGGGAGADDERAVSPEFRQSVSGRRHRRVLAPLAHHAWRFPPRSRLHPPGRQPGRDRTADRQPDGDDAVVRPVARGGLAVRAVGRFARAVPGHPRDVSPDRDGSSQETSGRAISPSSPGSTGGASAARRRVG